MTILDELKAFAEKSSSNLAVDLFMQAQQDCKLHYYQKYGYFTAERALYEQRVDTIINGVVETTNIANPGDYIVTGRQNEMYVLSPEKMDQRYRYVSGKLYEAVGNCYAFKYLGRSFTFMAPWGEEMICNYHDYICSTGVDGSDVYRIEQSAFLSTYRLVG